MVTWRLKGLAAFLLLVPAWAFAAVRCTPGSEYVPALCPARLPPIAEFFIETNGAGKQDDFEVTAPCSAFMVNDRILRRYFARAREVQNAPDALHYVLAWSPCYAQGTLRFRNGLKARWTLSRDRVASLYIDGRPGHQTLFCQACELEPPFR